MSSSQQTLPMASATSSQPTIATSEAPASKPKPCCVCKPEKSKRDECMLFSKAADPVQDCKSTVDQYRTCMAGFGFNI